MISGEILKNVEMIRSKRKTAAIQVLRGGRIVVRAPRLMPKMQIMKLLNDNALWIEAQIEKIKAREAAEADIVPLTNEDIASLVNEAKSIIPIVTKHYAEIMNVSYGRITIRNQKTRWGSCSSKGNFNFNCLLMLCPREAMEYVIIHELCHRRYMNHSAEFWAEVGKYCPDYKTQKQWFKDNGADIMRRMTGNG